MAALSLAYGRSGSQRNHPPNLPAAARLEVDNVHGYIHVSGYNGSEIQMVAEKTIEAESQRTAGSGQAGSKAGCVHDRAIHSLSMWMGRSAAIATTTAGDLASAATAAIA